MISGLLFSEYVGIVYLCIFLLVQLSVSDLLLCRCLVHHCFVVAIFLLNIIFEARNNDL